MPPRCTPADEPYESLDLELGRALQSWTDGHSTSLGLEIDGPLEAPGMDPTWILRMHGTLIEAEVHLFYGPHVDVSVFLIQLAEDGMLVGGEGHLTPERLEEILNGLDRMNRGDAVPGWLRRPQRP